MEKVGVFIVDNQEIFRQGIRASLSAEEDISVVGDAEQSEETLSLLEAYMPDVVLLDIGLPSLKGLQLASQIGRRLPGVSVIVLSAYEDDTQLFLAIKAGAVAYLTKDVSPEHMAKTIRRVFNGEYPINETLLSKPDLAARILTQFQSLFQAGQEMQALVAPLSPREIEILNLVANGYANKQIGHTLRISEQTVKNHITSILRKLAANDRTHAVVLALRHGLISV